MKRHISLKVGDFASTTRTLTPEGFLLCRDVRLSKAPQVRGYYAAEWGGIDGFAPDQVINVITAADVLFNPQTIASFEGLDATDLHPSGNTINAANWKDHHVGIIQKVKQSGEFLTADLLIKDADMVARVQRNEQVELSIGYDADLELITGTAQDGTPYQAAMRNIIGDHIALVPVGRCGGDCRIGDQHPTKPPSLLPEKTMKLIVDGLPFETNDNPALEAALAKQAEKIKAADNAKLTIGDKQFGLSELVAVQAVVDAMTKENTDLKAKVADLEKSQVSPDQLDAMVKSRTDVIADAKRLKADIKVEGCTCEQIKRDVVTAHAADALVVAVLAGGKVADAKPEQIDTAFRALAAVSTTTPTTTAMGDALSGIKTTDHAVVTEPVDFAALKRSAWEV